ncbi:hypothetical protein F5878DRAFT_229837, partial [Lentinula raphanica]
ITHRAAYCLFARATLIDHVSFDFNGRLNDINYAPIFQKWFDRGFAISHCPPVKDLVYSTSGFSLGGYRWVGDKACWKIELDDHARYPDLDTIECNSWNICYRPSRVSIKTFRFQPQPLVHGIIVARQERRYLRENYDYLLLAFSEEDFDPTEAILATQLSQPRRSPSRRRSAAARALLHEAMLGVDYQLPSAATTRLVTANLLRDFHHLLCDIVYDQRGVKVRRSYLITRVTGEIAITVVLRVKPRNRMIDVCIYNDRVENLSMRGLDIRFTWPVE